MAIKKEKLICYGCGKDRSCYLEINQEPHTMTDVIEDLVCVLDPTNQTGYKWEYCD